jgi:hypothetical protein
MSHNQAASATCTDDGNRRFETQMKCECFGSRVVLWLDATVCPCSGQCELGDRDNSQGSRAKPPQMMFIQRNDVIEQFAALFDIVCRQFAVRAESRVLSRISSAIRSSPQVGFSAAIRQIKRRSEPAIRIPPRD